MNERIEEQIFKNNLPAFCFASDNLEQGHKLKPRNKAIESIYINPNPKALLWSIVFDIDKPGAVGLWDECSPIMPCPNWTSENPNNHHAHLGYVLSGPVSRTLKARGGPQRYLARIQHGLTVGLGADKAYNHQLTKNPLNQAWNNTFWHDQAFELDELRDYLGDKLPLKIPRATAVGEGRNVNLFDNLRKWAYRARLDYDNYNSWLNAVECRADMLNSFICPLCWNEVKATAKSVAKWSWENISREGFSKIQSARGSKGSKNSATKKQAINIDRQTKIINW